MNILLSIKPIYVDEILAGKKIFEFRKSIFKKKDISKVFIYSSSPVKKIVASFEIARIIADSPKNLWNKCQRYGGISENDFFEYFKNSDIGYAIEITNLNEFSEPINPYKLKKNFKPPQSYFYLPLDYFENKSINSISRIKNQDMVISESDNDYLTNLDDNNNTSKTQKQTKFFNEDRSQKMTELSEELLKNSIIIEEKIGWIETELSQVAEIIMGQSPPSSTYNENGIGLPFFQGKAEFTELHPIVLKWCSEPNKIAESNDILISVRAPVGATNIANQKCCIGRGLAAIRYLDCNKYVFYFLRLIENELDKKGTGTTFKAISGSVLKSEKIPLAPLPEQRAIVSKIEQLFSELDNGIANLKLAQEQLKVYRQAVLDKTTRTEKFVSINTVVNELGQGWSPKCYNEPSTNNEEWGVIKTTAIQAGFFDEKENKRLPAHLEPRVKHELKAGDILITRAGPRVRVGVCCLVKKVRPRLINCDKAYRILLKENLILPQFFEYTLNSPKYTRMMENLKTGINDSGVNLTQNRFLDLEIPLPSLPEQQAIVQEIETRLSVCDKIEQDIETNLEKAEALRQSILKKAFEGKLLNERELAEVRGAEDWEPAEVLLERIKAEKVQNGKK